MTKLKIAEKTIIYTIFQLRREGRVNNVTDVVQKGQSVKVKVLSYTGNKMSLSMKVGMLLNLIINYFLASSDFCHLLKTYANSLDPDQDRQNVGPDLDSNCLTL